MRQDTMHDRMVAWRRRNLFRRLVATGDIDPGYVNAGYDTPEGQVERHLHLSSTRFRQPQTLNERLASRFFHAYCHTEQPEGFRWPEYNNERFFPWVLNFSADKNIAPYLLPAASDMPPFYPGMQVICTRSERFGWAWGPEHTVTIEKGEVLTIARVAIDETNDYKLQFVGRPNWWFRHEYFTTWANAPYRIANTETPS